MGFLVGDRIIGVMKRPNLLDVSFQSGRSEGRRRRKRKKKVKKKKKKKKKEE